MPFYLLLLLTLLGGSAAAADDDAVTPSYRAMACPFDMPAAQCGMAILPEDWNSRRGRVSIAIVQLGRADNGQPPAVILGGGGPGGGLYLDEESGILAWEEYRQRITGADGRLILIDQRGAGLSRPLLNCPEEKAIFISLLEQPRSLEQEAEMWHSTLQRCYTRLTNAGVRIEAYSTEASADDVDAIRRLLGIERWHIIGFSYGTRLALEVLRRHPQGVLSAVLDSPLPYDAAQIPPFYTFAALITLIDAHCREQSGCRRHGGVRDNLVNALEHVAAEPTVITQSYRGTPYRIALSPLRLLDIIYNGIYYSEGAAVLPFFSRQLAQGDVDNANSDFFTYYYLEFNLEDTLASMLNWSINCRENRALPPPAQTVLQGYEHRYWHEYIKICDSLWPQRAPPPAIVSSTKPILVLSGAYDPVTPPQWGAALKRRLPNAQHIIAAAAHAPSFSLPCLQDDIYAFFQAPLTPLNSHCAEQTLIFY